MCDLLLLNASNYPGNIVYPYAFVQVSALARLNGLAVERFDFLGTSRAEWRSIAKNLIQTHKPSAIGFHLRQADSQSVSEYRGSQTKTYRPVDMTSDLMTIFRNVTDVPIIVGGFGLTAQPLPLCQRLKPDFAVAGEPDGLLDNFFNILSGNDELLSSTPNLVFRRNDGYVCSTRKYFGPLQAPEYNEEIVQEIFKFYAQHGRALSVLSSGVADVPVEISRGCPCRCYFCNEPQVKGRKIRYREFDAVMQDVAFLADHGIRSFWFVCSELNIGGMDHPLHLAKEMTKFNQERRGQEVTWTAYSMPNPGMSKEDLGQLTRSGFVPGWNEFLSFDDNNLRHAKMPYRTKHAVRFYNDVLDIANDPTIECVKPPVKFEAFLGNAFADPTTIRKTLEVVDENNYATKHRWANTIRATRVYERDGALTCGTADQAFSIGRSGRQALDVTMPSFHYAPALLRHLESEERVEAFFDFIERTYLSTMHSSTLDVADFVRRTTSPTEIAILIANSPMSLQYLRRLNFLGADGRTNRQLEIAKQKAETIIEEPAVSEIEPLFLPTPVSQDHNDDTLTLLFQSLVKLNGPRFVSVLKFLGLPSNKFGECNLSSYRVAEILYRRYQSVEDLVENVRHSLPLAKGSINYLQLRYLIYKHNVIIEPRYRELLFEPV